MRDLAEVAQRLRAVHRARQHFLKMAAAERAFIEPMLDRIAEDLDGGAAIDAAGNDPADRDGDNSDPFAPGTGNGGAAL